MKRHHRWRQIKAHISKYHQVAVENRTNTLSQDLYTDKVQIDSNEANFKKGRPPLSMKNPWDPISPLSITKLPTTCNTTCHLRIIAAKSKVQTRLSSPWKSWSHHAWSIEYCMFVPLLVKRQIRIYKPHFHMQCSRIQRGVISRPKLSPK